MVTVVDRRKQVRETASKQVRMSGTGLKQSCRRNSKQLGLQDMLPRHDESPAERTLKCRSVPAWLSCRITGPLS